MPTLSKSSRPTKLYNIKEVAQRLGVHRQTVKYWLTKGWVTPSLTYGGFAVFTNADVRALRQWRDREGSSSAARVHRRETIRS